ncbi:MAG: ABC transporter substrate-binding protein [Deltaproteobacteria bacterium]|nr:ABC transporter substrate-binding protein [Deltaproteobacteria bacterium]
MERRPVQRMSMTVRVIALISGVLLLVGAGLIAQPAPAMAQEKVSMRLSFIPTGYDGPYFTAQGKGYYREEGLDVTIARGFGSGDTVKRLTARSDTFGSVAFFTAVQAVAEGAAIKVVGAGLGEGAGAIIALKKSGIRTLKDLEGRTLATSPGNAFALQLPALFRAAKIDASKVRTVDMDIVLKSGALVAGKVDAIVGLVAAEPAAFKVKGVEVDVIEYRQYLKMLELSVTAHRDLVSQKPDLIRRFLRASYRGARDFVHNVPAAVEFISRAHPAVDRQVYTEQAVISLPYWATTVAKERGFGWIDETLAKNTIEVASGAYNIARPPRPEELYTNELLPAPPIKP